MYKSFSVLLTEYLYGFQSCKLAKPKAIGEGLFIPDSMLAVSPNDYRNKKRFL